MAVDAELIGRHVQVLTATQIPVVDAAGNDTMKYGKQWSPSITSKISDGKDTELSANKRKTKIKTGWAGSSSNSTTASASGLGCSSPSSTVGPWARGGSTLTPWCSRRKPRGRAAAEQPG